MGKTADSKEVVLLFDHFSVDSQDLLASFRRAGYGYPAAVIEDDGFLPDGVTSVYGFFLGDFRKALGENAGPKYFNEISTPEYWQISGNNSSAEISDLHRKRGRIFYAEPLHKRLVKIVDWYDERGVVRSSDHYNRYGAVYARTVFNAKGQKVNKSYFSPDGREIIVENFVTGDIILNEGREIQFFRSRTDFVVYFLEKAGFGQSRLYFNSLSTPFFVSNRLGGFLKSDILFWQEPVGDAIPGNMQVILNGQAARTAKIFVQKKRAYERLLELGASAAMVERLGFLYDFERENRHRPEALICTNSDNIEHCREAVAALVGMHFHIAALTEMSPKLLSMEDFDNVSLYPSASRDVLDGLFKSCDYYFDINHAGEIVSAVRRAFLGNLLICAFQETAHNRDYVAKGHIYPAAEAERMFSDIKAMMEDGELLEKHLKMQHKAALAEDKAAYSFLFKDNVS